MTNYVPLSFVPGCAWAGLRELCGCDEQIVEGSDTEVAIQLLDRLLVGNSGDLLEPGSAAKLTAADRDRLLAAVFASAFGQRVTGSTDCARCGERFELDFDLGELLAAVQPQVQPDWTAEKGDPSFELADGRRFRLPKGEDELAIRHLPPDEAERELLRRCVVQGDPTQDPKAVQDAMKAAAPVLDLELDAQCPECQAAQPLHFDIQSYLLSSLQGELPRLTQEIHLMATAYGWGLNEILSITRSRRRAYVSLIEGMPNPVGRR